MIRLTIPHGHYRVMTDHGKGTGHHHVYRGNNLSAAVSAFMQVLPIGLAVNIFQGKHVVTGAPLIEARRTDGKVLAVLIGADWAEWEAHQP